MNLDLSTARRLLAACAAWLALGAAAQAPIAPTPLGPIEQPLWLRHPAISPDGRQVAFAYQGSLYLVPAAGGSARLLVGNGHHATRPVWSPDGRLLAYASDVHGNHDVFVVAAEGGPARRLTTHSAAELPVSFTPDSRAVLFTAARQDSRDNVLFPSRSMPELYQVSVDGGQRPRQLLTTPALAARFNAAGSQLLYEDLKGYEDEWRKHQVSPVARDLWLFDLKSGRHRQLTTWGGEDRNPLWSPDERSVFFLSERSGSFNVWKMPLERPQDAEQVTRFERHPVRFLSQARDGTLCFGFDGELYTLAPGAAAPRKLAVQLANPAPPSRIETLRLSQGATEMATSPDGQEVAFAVRGEIFVVSTEFGDTRRITSTPGQERSVSFSPDGRRLLFAGEHEGSWNLYEATLPGSRKDNPYFFAAAQVPVRTLLKNGKENFQPRYSPDGLEVAYLEERTTLKVLNLASGQTRVVLPGAMNYSYADGDQWFEWSPDGRSLLVNFLDRTRWSYEVGLIDAQGKGPLLNLSKSGYEDEHPVFAQGGRMVLWFSDRLGLRGASGRAHKDAFGMFLTTEAFDRFNLDKAEYALLKKAEDDEAKAKDDKKDVKKDDKKPETKGGGKADAAKKPGEAPAIKLPDPVVVEREGLQDRVVRLTPNSGNLRAAVMTADGEGVLFVVQTAEAHELWLNRPRQKELKKVAAVPASKPGDDDEDTVILQLDAKGENGFLLAGGNLHKFKVPKGEGEIKLEGLKFSAVMPLDRAAERAAIFEHVWRQMLKKLYVADMNGVDWAGYRKAYERFLPHIGNNHDLAELLSEMLGELNVSHTGAGYRPRVQGADSTAALGAFFDEAHGGAGLKLAEIVDGGPLALARLRLRAGMVIETIDGVAIAAGAEVDSLLNQKAGQRVQLGVFDPATQRRFEEVVRPISQREQGELLYQRWVKRMQAMVERLSGGKLGYVHVRGMNDDSYRDVFADVFGRHSDKQGLIVDTRFNGGGNLAQELAMMLSGKRSYEALPRGQSIGWEPGNRWTLPSLVVMGEANYSDAHLFPWVYRHLGIGKLLGMPVAGTGTAVWWETLQEPAMYFGIPQVGFRSAKGEWMETTHIEPDIRVPNAAAGLAAGRDAQIEAAVKELLKK